MSDVVLDKWNTAKAPRPVWLIAETSAIDLRCVLSRPQLPLLMPRLLPRALSFSAEILRLIWSLVLVQRLMLHEDLA